MPEVNPKDFMEFINENKKWIQTNKEEYSRVVNENKKRYQKHKNMSVSGSELVVKKPGINLEELKEFMNEHKEMIQKHKGTSVSAAETQFIEKNNRKEEKSNAQVLCEVYREFFFQKESLESHSKQLRLDSGVYRSFK